MILFRRLTAVLTQLLMIQFAILSGSAACPMAGGPASPEALDVRMSAGVHGLDGASAAAEMSPSPRESEQPNGGHHHDGHNTSSHCAQSCAPGACASAHCATVSVRERPSFVLWRAGRVEIPAGFEGVPSWFARAPEPPPPRA